MIISATLLVFVSYCLAFKVETPKGPGYADSDCAPLECFEYSSIKWDANSMPANTKFFSINLMREQDELPTAVMKIVDKFPHSSVGQSVVYLWNNAKIHEGGSNFWIEVVPIAADGKEIEDVGRSEKFNVPNCFSSTLLMQ